MKPASYRSSVLTCYVELGHCPVCNYLDGDDSEETLVEVIRILDASLAECEEQERRLLTLIPLEKLRSELGML